MEPLCILVGVPIGFVIGVALGYILTLLSNITQSNACSFFNLSFVFIGLCACSFIGSAIAYYIIDKKPRSNKREANLGMSTTMMSASLCFLPGALYGQIRSEADFIDIATVWKSILN